ncbi:hypothetical protein [Streptomyces youssoufiensis]
MPLAELRESLAGPVEDEPPIRAEIERALAAAGQGYDRAAGRHTPVWAVFVAVGDQYRARAGGGMGEELEPPRPTASAMRAAAARLTRHLATYPAHTRERATAPEVASGPLVITADRVQMVTTNSVRTLLCPQGHAAHTVRVDGPVATYACQHASDQMLRALEAARVRMALARAAGVHPSTQGTHVVPDLLIASANDLDRHTDPQDANVFLRQQPDIVGRDDLVDRLAHMIREHRPS